MAKYTQHDETPKAILESSQGAFNILQAAFYAGVKCAAIESAVRDGKLRGRRLGRNVIILKADLDAFLGSLDVIPAHTPASILRRRRERSQRNDLTGLI
jgi:hypothetical protein